MITDEMLAIAADELNEAMIRCLPEPEECQHVFSDRFERKMKRVINKGNHPVTCRVMQRAASILLILFISFMTLMVISPTVRATVVEWIKEQYATFTEYYFPNDAPDTEDFASYEISPLPEDYQLSFISKSDRIERIVYSNKSGKKIKLAYIHNAESVNAFIETENMLLIETTVKNKKADLYLSQVTNGTNGIVWYIEEENTVFLLTGKLKSHELIEIAENVVKK